MPSSPFVVRTRTLPAAILCVGVITSAAAGSRAPGIVATTAQGPPAASQHWPEQRLDRDRPYRESVALRWNAALLDAVRAVRFTPVSTARALAGYRAYLHVRRLVGLRCARRGHRVRR